MSEDMLRSSVVVALVDGVTTITAGGGDGCTTTSGADAPVGT